MGITANELNFKAQQAALTEAATQAPVGSALRQKATSALNSFISDALTAGKNKQVPELSYDDAKAALLQNGTFSAISQYGESPSGESPVGQGRAAAVPGTLDDRMLLAKTIQAEAGGEGYDGMLAVGSVIGNRARLGKYGGNDLRSVIMAPGQFSAWNGVTGYAKGEGGLNMDRIKPSQMALQVADAIIAGGYSDPTGGATHYYNPSVATPRWGRQAGGNWQTIGNHIFGFADGRPGAGPA